LPPRGPSQHHTGAAKKPGTAVTRRSQGLAHLCLVLYLHGPSVAVTDPRDLAHGISIRHWSPPCSGARLPCANSQDCQISRSTESTSARSRGAYTVVSVVRIPERPIGCNSPHPSRITSSRSSLGRVS